jgi:hypothetical protein
MSDDARATVTCSGHPDQHLPSRLLWRHLDEYVCDNFGPKFANADLMAFFTALGTADHPVAAAVTRWLQGPPNDVTIEWHRGNAMLSVSADNLKAFEHDSKFKSYAEFNHMFADLLVPLDDKLQDPMMFFLAQANSPGVSVSRIENPDTWILSLGRPYSFGEVVGAIGHVLEQQDVNANSAWFTRRLTDHMVDPRDPAFRRIVGPA